LAACATHCGARAEWLCAGSRRARRAQIHKKELQVVFDEVKYFEFKKWEAVRGARPARGAAPGHFATPAGRR
jgi:hypothetical protein